MQDFFFFLQLSQKIPTFFFFFFLPYCSALAVTWAAQLIRRISTIMTMGDAINELVVVQLFIIQMCTLLDGSTFASRKSSLRTFI